MTTLGNVGSNPVPSENNGISAVPPTPYILPQKVSYAGIPHGETTFQRQHATNSRAHFSGSLGGNSHNITGLSPQQVKSIQAPHIQALTLDTLKQQIERADDSALAHRMAQSIQTISEGFNLNNLNSLTMFYQMGALLDTNINPHAEALKQWAIGTAPQTDFSEQEIKSFFQQGQQVYGRINALQAAPEVQFNEPPSSDIPDFLQRRRPASSIPPEPAVQNAFPEDLVRRGEQVSPQDIARINTENIQIQASNSSWEVGTATLSTQLQNYISLRTQEQSFEDEGNTRQQAPYRTAGLESSYMIGALLDTNINGQAQSLRNWILNEGRPDHLGPETVGFYLTECQAMYARINHLVASSPSVSPSSSGSQRLQLFSFDPLPQPRNNNPTPIPPQGEVSNNDFSGAETPLNGQRTASQSNPTGMQERTQQVARQAGGAVHNLLQQVKGLLQPGSIPLTSPVYQPPQYVDPNTWEGQIIQYIQIADNLQRQGQENSRDYRNAIQFIDQQTQDLPDAESLRQAFTNDYDADFIIALRASRQQKVRQQDRAALVQQEAAVIHTEDLQIRSQNLKRDLKRIQKGKRHKPFLAKVRDTSFGLAVLSVSGPVLANGAQLYVNGSTRSTLETCGVPFTTYGREENADPLSQLLNPPTPSPSPTSAPPSPAPSTSPSSQPSPTGENQPLNSQPFTTSSPSPESTKPPSRLERERQEKCTFDNIQSAKEKYYLSQEAEPYVRGGGLAVAGFGGIGFSIIGFGAGLIKSLLDSTSRTIRRWRNR